MKAWFHGTPHDFETFDSAMLGKGYDQLGSGFYFTDREATARNYASGGFVIVAELAIENPLPPEASFSRGQIESILRASPRFGELICNWGDVDFEGEDVVVSRAVNAYADMNARCDDALQVLNAISNDLWQGREAEFLAAVRDATGHDGLFRPHPGEMHAIAWFPEQVRIIERRPAASFRP